MSFIVQVARRRLLSVREGTVRECGPGEPCGAVVWQSNASPGSSANVLTIKFGLSTPLLASQAASLTLKGLRNAVMTEGVHPLEGAVVEEHISDFADGRTFTACSASPLRVAGEDSGDASSGDGTWRWRQRDEAAIFYLESDLSPGIWYYLRIGLGNPLEPQDSPASSPAQGAEPMAFEVQAHQAAALENPVAVDPGRLPPLLVLGASFVVRKIGQVTYPLSTCNDRLLNSPVFGKWFRRPIEYR